MLITNISTRLGCISRVKEKWMFQLMKIAQCQRGAQFSFCGLHKEKEEENQFQPKSETSDPKQPILFRCKPCRICINLKSTNLIYCEFVVHILKNVHCNVIRFSTTKCIHVLCYDVKEPFPTVPTLYWFLDELNPSQAGIL